MSDKLTRSEQVRLEALNQAVVLTIGCGKNNHTDNVLRAAKEFAAFIENGLETSNARNRN